MPALRWVLDFLELRQVLTLRAVQACWWLYILQKLYSTTWRYLHTVAPGLPPDSYWRYDWFEWLFTPLRTLVALATARLLLEVLLTFLMPTTRQVPRDAMAFGRELLSFVDLRKPLTHSWVQVFWWLFLLTVLREIYPYFVFGAPWQIPGRWPYFLSGLLDKLIWLFGVRLLVEVMLSAEPRPASPGLADR